MHIILTLIAIIGVPVIMVGSVNGARGIRFDNSKTFWLGIGLMAIGLTMTMGSFWWSNNLFPR